jgi:hypothetical protein
MDRAPQTSYQGPRDDQASLASQMAAVRVLSQMPVADAMGAACSFLLSCSYNHREMFRRVMNEKVIREGFTGISLIELFKRVCR